jgi:uncharacterized protein YecE (DUF72 family)
MSILVGTASWTDKTLLDCGRFYPKEAKTAEARLRYYASIFPLVEVDSSYYGIPAPANAHHWVERTPEHFVFNVKAFRLFTGHQTDPKVLHKDIQQALGTTKTLYYRNTPPEISVELWRRFREDRPTQACGQARHSALPVPALAGVQPRGPRPCGALRRADGRPHREHRVSAPVVAR